MSTTFLKWQIGGEEQSLNLQDNEIQLGRRSDSDIVLLDPYVSRRHARLFPGDAGYAIEDLRSTHGTYVNGQRIETRVLQHGDRIQLGRGRIELLFVTGSVQSGPSVTTLDGVDDPKGALQLSEAFSAVTTEQSELEKISHILDFQYHWEKSFSPDRTFEQLLQSALKISGAERGFVLIKGQNGFRYVVGLDGEGERVSEAEFKTSHSVVEQVARESKPLLMTTGIDKEFAKQESIVSMDLRALACMPLIWISVDEETPSVHGILYLDSTKTMHALSGLDEKILGKLAVEMANVFEKLEMLKSYEERKAVEKELALAQQTQRSLLPTVIPSVKNLNIFVFNHPTRYVSGDFYDFFCADRSEELIAVLADVSGKGVSAALLSSFIQGALEMECRSQATLTDILNRTNQQLCKKTQSNRFVTLFLFQLNASGQGEYISAGHNPAYLYRSAASDVEELAAGDLILGAFDFAQYHSQPLYLEAGDILVVYTDGVTEARNHQGDMFGEPRLLDLIRRYGPAGADTLEDEILKAVHSFTEGVSQTDDITFMLVERVDS